MVYNAPADTNTAKRHGIIYNSEKSIGGIHYYNPDDVEAQDKTNKKVRFSVEKNKNSKTETPVLIIDSDPLKPESTVSKYGKKEEAPKSWRELREEKKEKERLLKEQKALEKSAEGMSFGKPEDKLGIRAKIGRASCRERVLRLV